MLVTTRATNCLTEERGTYSMYNVIKLFIATSLPFFLGLLSGKGTCHEITGGGDGVYVIRFQQIACHLQTNKTIVRHVVIKRPNNKVAVPKGILTILVEGVAIAFGKTSKIQPMTPPTFTISRIRKEMIN